MITALQMRAMRLTLQEKVASRAVGTGRNYEEMSKSRLKQWAKDIPVVALGTGLGYAGGRALGDLASRTALGSNPQARRVLGVGLPLATTVASSIGSYALGRQSALQRQRRDEAEALDRFNKSVKQAAPILAKVQPVFVRSADRKPVPDREKIHKDDPEGVLRLGDDE